MRTKPYLIKKGKIFMSMLVRKKKRFCRQTHIQQKAFIKKLIIKILSIISSQKKKILDCQLLCNKPDIHFTIYELYWPSQHEFPKLEEMTPWSSENQTHQLRNFACHRLGWNQVRRRCTKEK